MKQRYLVVYDYGQGGLWGYVLAESADDIERRYPDVRVIEEAPAWLDAELQAKLLAREEDIDKPGVGLLGTLLAAQEGDA
jgi:hypothetical protein